jgi:3-oxoacyl-[acyl-carrier protein] reductase
MRVALLGTDAERLDALVHDLHLAEGRYSTNVVQAEDRASVQAGALAVMATFGRVDVLFNFVGGWLGGKEVVDIEPEGLSEMLSQHVWTTFHLLQAFVPHLRANGWGRIVTISPPSTLVPQPKRAAYAAAKAAQEAMMLTLAQELKGSGVTANVIVIVAIDSKHERDSAPSPKTAQWTTPEEIAAALEYLISDEAHVVNGHRIGLYGG